MRIVDIRHASVPISRYAEPALASGGLDTSVVAVATDAVRDGRPVVGYGFGSIGRFSQDGLIRDRFAPRLLRAETASILTDDGTNLDPFRAWDAMMAGEKPGGHGERCVAVGTLDMAIWDAAAKIARQPLYRFLSQRLSLEATTVPDVPVYAGGGYYYPDRDIERLSDEICRLRDLGYNRVKIKIGAKPVVEDLQRIDAVAQLVGPANLAVDAMNAYDVKGARSAAAALAPLGLCLHLVRALGLGGAEVNPLCFPIRSSRGCTSGPLPP
jgi:L-alanine-DL-glutamate epimerase-like enolase superfamily enzyme